MLDRSGRDCSRSGLGNRGLRTFGQIEEAHAVARLKKRRRLPRQIPHLHRRGADDLPAARACLRIDAGKGTGQRHGACRDFRARALPARHLQRRIAADEIAEAGCETAEGHGEFARRMPLDHLSDG